MEPVGKDWILYDVVRILGSAQSFESGKRKLKLAENYSDLSTDDGEKSKKERRIRAAKKFDSDTDSDSEIVESVLKPFPKINAYKAIKTTTTIADSECENVLYVDNQLPSSSSESDHILLSDYITGSKNQKKDTVLQAVDNQLASSSSQSDFTTRSKSRKRGTIQATMKSKKTRLDIDTDFERGKENLYPCISTAGEQKFQQFMVKNMVDTKLTLKRYENILTNILTRLETSSSSQKEDHSTFISGTLDEFPVKDSETLQTVENCLKIDESYKTSVIQLLGMVGGNDLKSITINILTRTFTNSVAAEYSWLGGKKKLIFSNLYLWKIILNVVRRHIPHAVEFEISKHIKIWLAHATERLQREEKRNKNSVSPSVEEQTVQDTP